MQAHAQRRGHEGHPHAARLREGGLPDVRRHGNHAEAGGACGDVEIGLYTFADVSLDRDGVGPAQRVREIVEEIALADEVGLDGNGLGGGR
jgi:hypothetical protein